MKKNSKNKKNTNAVHKELEGVVEFNGVVEEALPATMFKVLCEGGHRVLATLSGKLKMNHIRVGPGDAVTIETSPYDLTRGRIVWRK